MNGAMRSLQLVRLWQSLGAALVLAVAYLSLAPAIDIGGPPDSDKLAHGVTYAVLAIFYGALYRPARFAAVALALVGLGAALEAIQAMLAYRSAELLDMLANGAGVAAGLIVAATPAGRALEAAEGLLRRVGVRSRT